VVGDRLDTDLAGANAANLPSLMVLTGVSTAEEAIFAPKPHRPTYLANDLRALGDSADRLRIAAQPSWHVDISDAHVTVTGAGEPADDDGLSVIRAVADAVWKSADDPHHLPLRGGDDAASAALRRGVTGGILRSDSVNTS
jgi:glycerol-1-phosphatase